MVSCCLELSDIKFERLRIWIWGATAFIFGDDWVVLSMAWAPRWAVATNTTPASTNTLPSDRESQQDGNRCVLLENLSKFVKRFLVPALQSQTIALIIHPLNGIWFMKNFLKFACSKDTDDTPLKYLAVMKSSGKHEIPLRREDGSLG